jgi:hypothetical protein
MYPTTTQHHPARAHARQPNAAPDYPNDIRPLITRHKLRRQRRRKAATLLTGASIALGAAALRTPSASAHSPKVSTPITNACWLPAHEPSTTPDPSPD